MSHMRALRIVVATALLATLALASAATAAEYTVVLNKMKFGPVPTGLHVGDLVIWQNDDILRHTATARDKSFDLDLPPHAQARLTLKTAGTIDFYCRFQPGMTGTLSVSP